MHPNVFLRTFWRMAWEPTVFVAMSFDSIYQTRFLDVFEPAIRALSVNGKNLSPIRVDLSVSGDSILSEINDGIAHSQLILADVSVVGRDAVTGRSYRNANVLYELGIALGCRRPGDVLLVRDDQDPFLFDVSTVPHATIDFSNTTVAKDELMTLLEGRLREQQFTSDARVELALAHLSVEEIYVLRPLLDKPTDYCFVVTGESILRKTSGIQRLLDQGLIRFVGANGKGDPAYALTSIGRAVAERVK